MFIVFDESGNEGLTAINGHSRWFCVVAIVFDNAGHTSIEDSMVTMHEIHGAKEFHFTDDKHDRRLAVLRYMSKLDFAFHAIACDKFALTKSNWRPPRPKKPKPIQSKLVANLIAKLSLPAGLDRLDVYFDTLGGRTPDSIFKTEFRAHLRTKLGRDLRLEIVAKDSKKTQCVQLADYVCGAFVRSLDSKKRNPEYFDILQEKCESRSDWP